MNIIEALKDLDPKNDAHWTADGLPKVDALKIDGLKRADITFVAPHFTRDNMSLELPDKIEEDVTCLLGSSVQPNLFLLEDGTEMLLGDVVRAAVIKSELSDKEWNELSVEDADKAEAFIQAVVDELPLMKEEGADDANTQNKAKEGENKDEGESKDNSQGESTEEEEKIDLSTQRLKAMEEVAKAQKQIVEARKNLKEKQDVCDKIENQLEVKTDHQTTQHDIQAFIKSQTEIRKQKAKAHQEFMKQGFDISKMGKSPIDKALAAKNSRKVRPINK